MPNKLYTKLEENTELKLSTSYSVVSYTSHNCNYVFSYADIDECSTNSHSCDINMVCNNTVGSYACARKAGYIGRPCKGVQDSLGF